MKAEIDRSGCISCGLCVETCPEVFRIADDDLAEVYTQPDEDTIDNAKDAEQACPVSVITVEE